MDGYGPEDFDGRATEVMGTVGSRHARPEPAWSQWPAQPPVPEVWVRDRWTAYARDLAIVLTLLALVAVCVGAVEQEIRMGWWS